MHTDYGPLLDSLRGVTWPARRAALAGTAGTHRSRLRGLSAEFTEYRPYRQGDDPRRLDWKLLARTDRAFLRITSDRATLGTILVVDGSASMAFPERTLDKWTQACRVAVGLAALAHGSGDPVGLLIPGGGRVEPRTRRGVLAEIARVLDAHRPAGAAAMAPAIDTLRGTPRIALISDFLGDADDTLRIARRIGAGGTELHAAHIVSELELEPPDTTFLATDPEDHETRRPLVAENRAGYQVAYAEWRLTLARAFRAGGASFTEVRTGEAAGHAVRRIAGVALAMAQ